MSPKSRKSCRRFGMGPQAPSVGGVTAEDGDSTSAVMEYGRRPFYGPQDLGVHGEGRQKLTNNSHALLSYAAKSATAVAG